MIELCDLDKLKEERYSRINQELVETLGRMRAITKSALIPGDHYCFDYAFIVNRIRNFKDLKFLDLGCAASTLPVYISEQGGEVTAIDLPKRTDLTVFHAKLKKELGIPIQFLGMDFCTDPLPKSDVIVSCSSIEHNPYSKVPGLMENIRNSLSKGGQFIFTVIAEPTPPEKDYGSYFSYDENRIRDMFLDGFELEKQDSNFDQFDILYQKFRKQFPWYWYMPLGISLIRK